MRKEIPRPTPLPVVDATLLIERLANVRGALGAARLGIARRRTAADAVGAAEAFEILAVVDARGAMPEAERQLPAMAFQRILTESRLLEAEAGADSDLGRWLRDHGGLRLCGWPLPHDRAVSVMAVARFDDARSLGTARSEVARAGLEALARALAPPAWAPLAGRASSPARPSAEARVAAIAGREVLPLREALDLMERVMIQRALQCSEGNKAAAARSLQLSRQGLYKKLRRHGLA